MRWAARVSLRIYETVDWETLAARATSLMVGRDGIEALTVRVGETGHNGIVKPRRTASLVPKQGGFGQTGWWPDFPQKTLDFHRTLWRATGLNFKVKKIPALTGRKWNEMRKRIEDEFTYLPVSRQRKYQLRMQRDQRCTECGEPAVQGSRCLKHLVKARERQRKKRGLKRRYYGTLSYKLQAVNK